MKRAPTIKAGLRILGQPGRPSGPVIINVPQPLHGGRTHAAPVKSLRSASCRSAPGAAPSCDAGIGRSDRSVTPRTALKGWVRLPPRGGDEGS